MLNTFLLREQTFPKEIKMQSAKQFMNTIKEALSIKWAAMLKASQVGRLVQLLMILSLPISLSGCIKKEEVNAAAWLNSGLPQYLCDEVAKTRPEILKFGLYRVLDSGKVEHVHYCDQITNEEGKIVPTSQGYTSFKTTKLDEWLEKLFPKD